MKIRSFLVAAAFASWLCTATIYSTCHEGILSGCYNFSGSDIENLLLLGWLKESHIIQYQTLIAGAFAIFAAFIGGAYINKQISHANMIEERRRHRAFAANRATLSLALSLLIRNVRHNVDKLLEARNLIVGGPHLWPDDFEFLPPPAEALSSLKALIEHSGPGMLNSGSRILNKIQIFESRIQAVSNHIKTSGTSILNVTARNIDNYILDAVDIIVRCEDLFSFARGDAIDHVYSDPDMKKLTVALIIYSSDPRLEQHLIERLHERYAASDT